MAGMDFKIEGLDELEKDLTEALRKYPVEMEKGLRKVARDFKKSVKDITPEQSEESHRGNPALALHKKFGIRVLKDGVGMVALVYNSSPHFHLVENGHEVVRDGKTVGFAPGQYMMERTRKKYESIVPERFRSICDETLRRNNL